MLQPNYYMELRTKINIGRHFEPPTEKEGMVGTLPTYDVRVVP